MPELVSTKLPISYEKRLQKMSNPEIKAELRRGVRGELDGYKSVPLAIALSVILDSHTRGQSPYPR